MSRKVVHEIAPLVAAILTGVLIQVGAQTTGWASAWTYLLAGVAGTCLVLIGVPVALGLSIRFIAVSDSARPEMEPKIEGAALLEQLLSEQRHGEPIRSIAFSVNVPSTSLTIGHQTESFMAIANYDDLVERAVAAVQTGPRQPEMSSSSIRRMPTLALPPEQTQLAPAPALS